MIRIIAHSVDTSDIETPPSRQKLVRWEPSPTAARSRLIALTVFAGCLSLLGVASRAAPDPAWVESQRKANLIWCSVPLTTGYPCPTCGMTTAFAYWMRAQPAASFHSHPGGFALAATTTGTTIAALVILATGRVWRVDWRHVSPVWLPVTLAVLIIGGWGYKIVTGLLAGTLPLAR